MQSYKLILLCYKLFLALLQEKISQGCECGLGDVVSWAKELVLFKWVGKFGRFIGLGSMRYNPFLCIRNIVMLLIDFLASRDGAMADYAARIAEASVASGCEIIAAPVGLEHGVVQVLLASGVAVRCVTLYELQQIRDQQEITVFRA
jgi:hypothetical protein